MRTATAKSVFRALLVAGLALPTALGFAQDPFGSGPQGGQSAPSDPFASGPGGGLAQQGSGGGAADLEVFEGAVPAESITAAHVGQEIALVGTIADMRPSSSDRSPTTLVLVPRSSGAVSIVYWPELAALNAHAKPGARVTARGKLDDYRGNYQIRIRSLDQIRFAGGADIPVGGVMDRSVSASRDSNPWGGQASTGQQPASAGTVSSFLSVTDLVSNSSLLSNTISVSGVVSNFRESWSETAPNVVTIGDGTSEVELVFWTAAGESVRTELTQVGTPLFATGLYQDYRGRMQVRLENQDWVSTQPLGGERMAPPPVARGPVESAASGWNNAVGPRGGSTPPPAAAAPAPRPTAPPPAAVRPASSDPFSAPAPGASAAESMLKARDLNASLDGRNVSISGRVVRIAPVTGGRMVVVHDETGLAMVAIRADVASGTDAASIRIDDIVKLKGTVKTSADKRQVWVNLDRGSDLTFQQ